MIVQVVAETDRYRASHERLAVELTNRNVLVTGATSGIGNQLAGQLAARGNRVFACGRDPGRLAELRTVDGIEVRCKWKNNGTFVTYFSDIQVQLNKGALRQAPTGSANHTLTLSEAIGGPTDKWGTTWTAAEVNAEIFGVTIFAAPGNLETVFYVDYCQITVSYH